MTVIRYIFTALLLNLMLSISAYASCTLKDKASGKIYRIFNGLLYKEMPDLADYCIENINIMYAWEFFPGQHKDKLAPPKEADIKHAIQVIKNKGMITVVDIEHWPLKKVSTKEAEVSITNYKAIIDRLTTALPNIMIGFYGVIPVTDFSRAKKPNSNSAHLEWVEENNRLKYIADKVRAAFPSLYTINSSRQDWLDRAASSLAEARRLVKNKPIYPFIWPNYHEQDGRYKSGTEVESDYWKLQLAFLRENSDGIVLWGGYNQRFDEMSRWWQVTKTFIKESFVIEKH